MHGRGGRDEGERGRERGSMRKFMIEKLNSLCE